MDCHICKRPNAEVHELGAGTNGVSCPRCGLWVAIVGGFEDSLQDQLGSFGDPQSRHRRSKLSHIVRRGQSEGKYFGVVLKDLPSMGLDGPTPTPLEQLDELVLWLGQSQEGPSDRQLLNADLLSAWIGAPISVSLTPDNLGWLLNQPPAMEYIFVENPGSQATFRLTMPGWARFEQLKAAKVDSRFAFMAMKFGDPELDKVFETCFSPAVAEAGFELQRLIDGQAAGLIDDQMRVRLRSSRFVLADLSHGNNGAYWEAGFAEGLGRPVIYTCRKSVWQSEDKKPHFDTGHLVTIIWDPDDLPLAANQLTATIRATLPGEARMPSN